MTATPAPIERKPGERKPGERKPGDRMAGALGKAWIVASIALATLLLAWPSAVNRGPFFIADTTAYIRSADAALASVLPYSSTWSDKLALYKQPDRGSEAPEARAVSPESSGVTAPAHPPLIGRSIYYGAFIYVPVLTLGEHAGVLVQAALSAIVVWLALVPIGLARGRDRLAAYFGTVALLALATGLPFVATMLVPDYLTGLSCAALVLLLCFWNDYSRREIVVLAGIIGLAALSHASNLPLLLALSLLGLAIRIKVPLSARAALIGIGAVALGLAGDALFVSAVSQKTGMTPIRPPFLTARLIDDGPGYQLLQTHCASERFEVCRYVARTPNDSDAFLWSTNEDGVFSAADFASQHALSKQDMRFAIATAREYPLATIASTGKSFVRQLGLLDLRRWRGAAGKPVHDLANLPEQVAARMARTLSVRGAMPVEPFQTAIPMVVLASLLAAIWCMAHARRHGDERIRRFGIAIALILVAILANAAITGGLSKPDARYNLRAIWLLPLFASMFLAAIFARRYRQAPISAGS